MTAYHDALHAYCLSMHQPWASLLVAGIKRVEGRPWPTDHRGRLWIASTAREASPLEVATLEQRSHHHHPNDAFIELMMPSLP